MTRKIALAAAPLALLAACSGSEPPPPTDDANAIDQGVLIENATDGPFVNAVPTPEPSETPTPDATTAPPLPKDEQMQDDADATGMTARVTREESQPADEAAPAEEAPAEKK